jgi:hypothetical protein
VIESYPGSDHCDYEDVTFLRVAWPLGTTGRHPRMYVRDPEGVLDEQTVAGFQPDADLPAGDQVEAWPRTKSLIGCD